MTIENLRRVVDSKDSENKQLIVTINTQERRVRNQHDSLKEMMVEIKRQQKEIDQYKQNQAKLLDNFNRCVLGTSKEDQDAETDFNKAMATVMKRFMRKDEPLNLLAPGHLDEEVTSFWGKYIPPVMVKVYETFANKVVKMFLDQVERQLKQQLVDDYRQKQGS